MRWIVLGVLVAWIGEAVGAPGRLPVASRRPADVTIDGCDRASEREIRRLLAIELGGTWVTTAGKGRPDALQVLVRCEGTVNVQAGLPSGGGVATRDLSVRRDLSPLAMARLVALAAAELVASLTSTGPGEGETVAVAKRAAPQGPPEPEQRKWVFGLFGSVAAAGDPTSGWFGGGASVSQRVHRWLGWRASALADYGTQDVSLGSTGVLRLSGALHLTATWHWRRFQLCGGVGGRLGAALFGAEAMDPAAVSSQSFWSAWGGPAALAAGALDLHERLTAEVGVEVGYVTLPAGALVDGRREVAVGGWWALVSLGIGFRL